MPHALVDRFINALLKLETEGDHQPIVDLFATDCETSNLALPTPLHGQEGAERFWREYRDSFRHVRSHFTHIQETPESAMLEWISEGQLKNGDPVNYRGISILEHDGNAIRGFRAYYDSLALRTQKPNRAA